METIKVVTNTSHESWKAIREIFRLNLLSLFPVFLDVQETGDPNAFNVILADGGDRMAAIKLLATLEEITVKETFG